jgi:DNA-binding CsgD family transcriptional regulator
MDTRVDALRPTADAHPEAAMTTARPDLGPLRGTERIACVIRLAVGLLTFVMTAQFAPLASALAVAAGVTAVGWSVLMFIALRSDLAPDQVGRLASWSHYFDIVLALSVYAVFLPDPEATPVAALPLLAYRLALRHGTAGLVAGALSFVGLVVGRIAFTRVSEGEFLVRPPMLMAWALTATLVLVLASEARSRAAAARAGGARSDEAIPNVEARVGSDDAAATSLPTALRTDSPLAVTALGTVGPPSVHGPAASTGDERLDSLAACLALKVETPQPVRLTDRELEVLVLLGEGHSYGAIASRLFISQSTVRNHVHNLRAKLDLSDRADLQKLARAVAARSGGPGAVPGAVQPVGKDAGWG